MEVVSRRFRPAGAMRVFSKPQTTGREIRWKKQNVRSVFMTSRNKRDFRQGTATRIMHVRRRELLLLLLLLHVHALYRGRNKRSVEITVYARNNGRQFNERANYNPVEIVILLYRA